MLMLRVLFPSYKIENTVFYYVTPCIISFIKNKLSVRLLSLKKSIIKISSMFLTYILQYIFSLSKITQKCPSSVVLRLLLTTKWRWLNRTIDCVVLVLISEENSQKASQNWQRCVLQNNPGMVLCRYNGHLEQPHSRGVSISSEYEVPSVQRKTTFLRLVLVTPQQTPGGAWQYLGQSMRGILLTVVQVLMAWCRFSCSRTIIPGHVSSACG